MNSPEPLKVDEDASLPVDPDDNRPFPIQGGCETEKRGEKARRSYVPCTVPWWLAEIAYESYVKSGGRGQSLERLAERGGFGRYELVALIRRELEHGRKEGFVELRDRLMEVVPQTFGEALKMYGEKVLCGEAHEWDNNTTVENVPFLVGLLRARLNELQGESDRDIGVVEREKRALREALEPCVMLLQDEKPGPDETSTPEEYNDWCDIIEKAQAALRGGR